MQTLDDINEIAQAAMRLAEDGFYTTALVMLDKIDTDLLSPEAAAILNRTKQQLIAAQVL
jgi:hypothetical protein